MTPEQFEAVARLLKWSRSSVAYKIARAHLVDGKRKIDVMAEHGTSRGNVSSAVNRVTKMRAWVAQNWDDMRRVQVTAPVPKGLHNIWGNK